MAHSQHVLYMIRKPVLSEIINRGGRTLPHSSWSSPEPCTYENPPARRPNPASPTSPSTASMARDALTHMTGKNVASGATFGKRPDAGVTHRGRSGRSSVGSAYDESCKSFDHQGDLFSPLPGAGGHTHREASGPHIEPRGYLRVLVRADCAGRGAQVPVHEPRFPRVLACGVRPIVGPAAQVQGAVDDGAPYRHGFGERVWETFACARRVD